MSEAVTNQSRTMFRAFGYFVPSFCLFVPTVGTLAVLILLNHSSNERLALIGAACVYLSSVILGLFNTKRFREYGRAEFWALIVGVTLSGVSGVVAAGAVVFSYVAAGLHIH